MRKGWVCEPVGRGNLAPTIRYVSANYGHASHKCQHTLATWVILRIIRYISIQSFARLERDNFNLLIFSKLAQCVRRSGQERKCSVMYRNNSGHIEQL